MKKFFILIALVFSVAVKSFCLESNITNLTKAIQSNDDPAILTLSQKIESEQLPQDYDIIQLKKDFTELINAAEKYISSTPDIFLVYDSFLSVADVNFESETYNYIFKTCSVRNIEKLRLADAIKNALEKSKSIYDLKLEKEAGSLFKDETFTEEFYIADGKEQIKGSIKSEYTFSKNDIVKCKDVSLQIKADSGGKDLKLFAGDNSSVTVISAEDFSGILKESLKLKELISNVHAVTLPKSIKDADLQTLTEYFGIQNVKETALLLYGDKLQDIEKILCTKEEEDFLEKAGFASVSNSYLVIKDKFIVSSSSSGLPRLKSVFKENAGKYIPMEFSRFNGNTFYLKYTDEMADIISRVYGKEAISKTTFKFYVPLLDLESRKKDAPAFMLSEEVVRDIKKSYPQIKNLKNDNYAGSNSTGSYGTKNDALKTFVIAADEIRQKNLGAKTETLPPVNLYLEDIEPLVYETLGEKQKFTNDLYIFEKPISKALYDKVIAYCDILKLEYAFTDYANLYKELPVFINALNYISGKEQFAYKEDGGLPLTMEEVHHYDYSCNGFMVPTGTMYEETKNSKNLKRMQKESGKNTEKFLYVLVK